MTENNYVLFQKILCPVIPAEEYVALFNHYLPNNERQKLDKI